jgi:hypothetical protein
MVLLYHWYVRVPPSVMVATVTLKAVGLAFRG